MPNHLFECSLFIVTLLFLLKHCFNYATMLQMLVSCYHLLILSAYHNLQIKYENDIVGFSLGFLGFIFSSIGHGSPHSLSHQHSFVFLCGFVFNFIIGVFYNQERICFLSLEMDPSHVELFPAIEMVLK